MITVLVVDDHPVVREGLRGMISTAPDLTAAGEAVSGADAVATALKLRPDVVLMDLRMPDMDGVAATRRILSALPQTRVIVVTTYETDADILRAVEAGASGYLLKDTSRDDLVAAIRAAAQGDTVLAPSLANRLTRSGRDTRQTTLSAREIEVLDCVAAGLSNIDIGRELYISETTVKTHLQRAFAKLDVTDRTAAVIAAMARGLLRP